MPPRWDHPHLPPPQKLSSAKTQTSKFPTTSNQRQNLEVQKAAEHLQWIFLSVLQRDLSGQPQLPPAQQSSCAGTDGTAGLSQSLGKLNWCFVLPFNTFPALPPREGAGEGMEGGSVGSWCTQGMRASRMDHTIPALGSS